MFQLFRSRRQNRRVKFEGPILKERVGRVYRKLRRRFGEIKNVLPRTYVRVRYLYCTYAFMYLNYSRIYVTKAPFLRVDDFLLFLHSPLIKRS